MFGKPTTSDSGEEAREPFLASSRDENWDDSSPTEPRSFFRRINYAAISTHCTIAIVYLLVITITTNWLNGKSSNVQCDIVAHNSATVDIYCEVINPRKPQ